MHPYVYFSIIYNNQDLETAKVSVSIWMDKKVVVHLHNLILLIHKKLKRHLTFCNSMDRPGDYNVKLNTPVGER